MTSEQIELLDGVADGSHWFVTGEVRAALKCLLDELDRLKEGEVQHTKDLVAKNFIIAQWKTAGGDMAKTINARTEELRTANAHVADLETTIELLQTEAALAGNDVVRLQAVADELRGYRDAYANAAAEARALRDALAHANFLLLSIDHILHGQHATDRHNPG